MEARSAFSFLPFWIEDAKLENNMVGRHLLFGLVALALAAFISQSAFADKTHEGKVIKAGDDKLTMTDKDGTEHTHQVAATAKITCDGKKCKLEDLKEGFTVKVTMSQDESMVTKIEAKGKNRRR